MTKARSEQISLDDTPFYHCYSRCVRRAFLCGVDKETGENFEHRKGWIVDRMKQLAAVFCMDVWDFEVRSPAAQYDFKNKRMFVKKLLLGFHS